MTNAVEAFLGAGDFRFTPHSPQSWIVFLGFSFLILVGTSNYTAVVTAAGVVRSLQASVSSLEEGIERGLTFCGWASNEAGLVAAHPRLRFVGLGDGKAIFQGMDNGLCDGAIMDLDAWEAARSGLFSPREDDVRYAAHPTGAANWHCDTKTLLPATVFSVDMAFPVRADLQRSLSWAINVAREDGSWAEQKAEAENLFLPPSQCTSDHGASQSISLSFWSGAGIIFISLFTTTVGLISNVLWRATPSQRAKRRDWLTKYRALDKIASTSIHASIPPQFTTTGVDRSVSTAKVPFVAEV